MNKPELHAVDRNSVDTQTQLKWDDRFLDYVTTGKLNAAQSRMVPDYAQVRSRRRQHIVEHVRQQLLDGDNDTWAVFLGIVETGHIIGETAVLANTIEQNRPGRNRP